MRKLVLVLALAFGLLVVFPPGAGAAEAQGVTTPEITLENAINRALAHSRDLIKADLEVEKSSENREEAEDQLGFIPIRGESYPAEIDQAWYGLLTADLTWEMSKKERAQAEDALVLSVCQQYWAVQAALTGVAVAEKAAEQADLEARLTQLGYQVGSKSQAEVTAAQSKQKQSEAALVQAQESLTAAYLSFNQLVGLQPGDRPVLTGQLTFAPLEVTDLGYEVARVISESPTTWQANEAVTVQAYLQDAAYASSSGSYRTHRVREIDKELAELNAADAEEATAQLVRTLYSRIVGLEAAYQEAEAAVAQATEAARQAHLRFDVGLATRLEVLAAEAALAQAEAAKQSVLQQHAYYKLGFQKPWAMSAG